MAVASFRPPNQKGHLEAVGVLFLEKFPTETVNMAAFVFKEKVRVNSLFTQVENVWSFAHILTIVEASPNL